MELDPRLQNISAADLQDFAVPHYPNFDQGYQSALYETALDEEHGASTHPHAQAYAQFVNEANDAVRFGSSDTPNTQHGVNGVSITRSQTGGTRTANTTGRNLNNPSTGARQPRQITQHPSAPRFMNQPFGPAATAVTRNGQLQHTPITRSSATSPIVQRASARSKPQQSPQSKTLPQTPNPTQSQPLQTTQTFQQQRQQQPQQQQQQSSPQDANPLPDLSQFTHPSTFPLVPSPPNLIEWREKFFNIQEPLLLTSEEYHTYFPHVDNIYSHRSTQKYKKKPFVSHYWDCRLKGRPTGTPLSQLRKRQEGRADDEDAENANDANSGGDKEVKKRKRKTRERDLCDVKIKVTEFFGRNELEALGNIGQNEQGGDDSMMENGHGGPSGSNGQLTFVLEDRSSSNVPAVGGGIRMSTGGDDSMPFGVLEPTKKLPEGHPGAEGKRWYMVQRVNGSGKEGDDASLDHKHTMEESDRIKKNSVQRWLLAQEKERKKRNQRNKNNTEADISTPSRSQSIASTPSWHASGKAQQTAKSHSTPTTTHLTFYANSFCPFAQRVWIALEIKGIPYQYVEVTPAVMKEGRCTIPALIEVCPEGVIPCLRHGNWGIWESDVILEYLEDLSIGHSLLPLGMAQLRAHSRLWKDHINRKVLPYFYALLLLPDTDKTQGDSEASKAALDERKSVFITTLQGYITELVNASHATGPFFLGADMSFVDVAFAPWIIRLSRVLEYYREFPKPEVGTRWKAWVDAIESNDAVRKTVSDDKSYHAVYGGVGKDAHLGTKMCAPGKGISELRYAQMMVRQEGFGLGGDVWGTLLPEENPIRLRAS